MADPFIAALTAAVTALWGWNVVQARATRRDLDKALTLSRKDQGDWRTATLGKFDDLKDAIESQTATLSAQHQEIRGDQKEQWRAMEAQGNRYLTAIEKAAEQNAARRNGS